MTRMIPVDRKLPNGKYARELLRQLPKGYKIAFAVAEKTSVHAKPNRSLGSHPYVFTPTGRVLRLDGMPVAVATTPGGPRTLRNDLARIRRAIEQASV